MSRAEDSLKLQYEMFPYPVRDPADERHHLTRTLPDSLFSINHFVFGGQHNLSKGLRVLVAGGGTGDAVIYISQQLHDLGIPAEVTYLDLSTAARRIAEQRAEARCLRNIHFETGSLLDLEGIVHGDFDYINCTGVLHHLEDPLQGLKTLVRKLRPNGGLGVMLYGTLGRIGVYHVQDILRIIAPGSLAPQERIRIARKLLANLPRFNWLKLNPAITEQEWKGDAELFDLLLHTRDVSYDVENANQLVTAAGLRIAAFVPPAVYEPSTYIQDQELLERMSHLRDVERAMIAEKLIGALNKLVFYVVRADNPVKPPSPTDLDFVPILENFPSLPPPGSDGLEVRLDGPHFHGTAKLTAQTVAILRHIDGHRRLEDIRKALNLQPQEFNAAVEAFYPWMLKFNYIVLSRTPLPKSIGRNG